MLAQNNPVAKKLLICRVLDNCKTRPTHGVESEEMILAIDYHLTTLISTADPKTTSAAVKLNVLLFTCVPVSF